ncbi:hypothetical protein C3K47_08775 [Solitalea longa]|uniref:Uncharacterized protein n=1 Tax=Solitalea longa TaxID=2079460 RepID=A0A2S5A3I9_9SPHI|nr:hypothetical protein C3K47_08775 [Solitalea longa]
MNGCAPTERARRCELSERSLQKSSLERCSDMFEEHKELAKLFLKAMTVLKPETISRRAQSVKRLDFEQ